MSVEAISATTEAYIGADATINGDNANANAQQDVDVVARDSTVVSEFDGVAGGGIAGVGGAVDVAVLANTTAASIGDGSMINAANDVLVNGFSNEATSSTVAAVAAEIGGLSGAISVLAIANGPSPDQTSETTTSGGQSVNQNANADLQDGSINKDLSGSSNSNVSNASAQAQSYKSTLSASSIMGGTTLPAGTSATIGRATIVAGGTVGADTQNDVNAIVLDGSATLGVGASAGIGVAAVNVSNTATIAAGANIGAGAVSVSADTQRTFSAIAISGAVSGGAAAAIGVEDGSTTKAEIEAATVGAIGSVTVNADNMTTANAATTAIAGGIGAGVTLAVFTPNTSAWIDNGAEVTAGVIHNGSLASIGDVTVSATGSQSLSIAGAGFAPGGVVGGALTLFIVNDTINAEIGAATVTATGNVAALANGTANGDVLVGGVAIGGLGLGASLGVSVLDTTTTASIDGGANVTAYGRDPTTVGYTGSYDGSFVSYIPGSSIGPASLPGVSAANGNSEDPFDDGGRDDRQ